MERLYLYGSIGWDIDAEFVRLALEESDGDIEVRINSGGGDVFEGQTIYSLLDDHKTRHNARVIVHVDALAASIASIIAMAGDEIIMSDGALMMIHNPWTPGAGGSADELRKTADVLDKIGETLVTVYENRTGLDRETIMSLMDDETWLTASEAINLGFADVMASDSNVTAASIAAFNYANAPKWLVDIPETPVAETTESQKAKRSIAAAKLALSRCCNKRRSA
tara:strand:- start:2423 stop:3094 length:672 start_codon:yes stop_codon:yes gene_type:complete